MGFLGKDKTEIPAPANYGPAFAVLVDGMDRMNEKLEELIGRQAKAPETRQELVTLAADVAYVYDNHGYKYWGLFLSAAVILNVGAMGIAYPLNLAQGFNKVVLPQGATLTATAGFTMFAVWSDHLEN